MMHRSSACVTRVVPGVGRWYGPGRLVSYVFAEPGNPSRVGERHRNRSGRNDPDDHVFPDCLSLFGIKIKRASDNQTDQVGSGLADQYRQWFKPSHGAVADVED